MNRILTEHITALYPAGTRILAAHSYRPGYLPYPMRVTLETPSGITHHCVAKLSDDAAAIDREAHVLQALAELAFPVPAVLAGPIELGDDTTSQSALILSELPGAPLPWLGVTSLHDADVSCRLICEAVEALHRLTPDVARHPVAKYLPHQTLQSEFAGIIARAESWLGNPLIVQAVAALRDWLPSIDTPLIFSNGDYNPLNFLYAGEHVTGWVDFAGACFEDPYIGFAKFILWRYDDYGWGTGQKAGLVERYLYAKDVSRSQFRPRLILRCLQSLEERVGSGDRADAQSSQYFLRVLEDNLS